MTSTIYLFPDTNFFVNCEALDQIDWRTCGDLMGVDEIHLLICLPVLQEIDNLKYRGDPVGQRANKAYKMVRGLITSSAARRPVDSREPRVLLHDETRIRPLTGLFEYATPDERIVGCAQAYQEDHRDRDVRFLTHDAGAMALAKHAGVPLIVVPDVWRADPPPTAIERRAAQLEAEIKRLRHSQPQFEVRFLGSVGDEPTVVTGSVLAARSLTDDEVMRFIDRLRESAQQSHNGDWLEACERTLRNLHTSMQHRSERPVVKIEVANQGVCPAEDALIEIVGYGPILLGAPLHKDSVHKELRQSPIQLPAPPKPFDMPVLRTGIDLQRPRERRADDPNAFYYKPKRPSEPAPKLVLECQQWRHGLDLRTFEVEIYVDSELPTIEGRIEFRIQAKNLADPVRKFVRVCLEGRSIETADRATALVEQAEQQVRAELAAFDLDVRFGRRSPR